MKTKEKIYSVYNMIRFFGISYYVPRFIKDIYYDNIKPIFKPHHQRYRKLFPRTWTDLTELIVVCNLEFIKGFYEDEYLNDCTDWNSTEDLKKFSQWLKKAHKYVTIERPKLEKDIENAYPKDSWDDMFVKFTDENGLVRWKSKDTKDPKKTYKQKYGKLEQLEKKLSEKDTKIITEMVNYRGYFWT